LRADARPKKEFSRIILTSPVKFLGKRSTASFLMAESFGVIFQGLMVDVNSLDTLVIDVFAKRERWLSTAGSTFSA
jgi:hypothetical protein